MYDLFIIHAARHVSLDKQGWGVLSGRMQSEKEPRDVWLGSTPRPESYYATTYYEPDGWLLVDQKAEIRVGSVGVAGLSGGERGCGRRLGLSAGAPRRRGCRRLRLPRPHRLRTARRQRLLQPPGEKQAGGERRLGEKGRWQDRRE